MFEKINQKLVENAASIFKIPAQLTPKPVQNKILLEALQQVFHEALEDGDFEFLEGKWLEVSIQDLDLHWWISFEDEKLVVADTKQQADVSFSGNLNDLVLIAGRKQDPDTLFFQRRLVIEGDTELGLEVKNLMDSVDLDALPKPLTFAMDKLADFVQKGVTHTDKRIYSASQNMQQTQN